MSRIVIFMRHGKAEDPDNFENDFERTLQKRGRLEVFEAAAKLKDKDFVPDVIISSPAFRTITTARIASSALGVQTHNIHYFSKMYMGNMNSYLDAANSTNKKTIMLVGHNPAVGDLAMHFSDNRIMGFPTSAMAVFRFKENEISLDSNAELLYYDLRD